MKIQHLLLLPVAVGALCSSAYSQAVVDITGSTAGRSAVHSRILALLGASATYAYDGTSSAAAATRAIYHGTFSGSPITIRTYWSGSVNGVRDVAQQIQQTNFFQTSVIGTIAGQNIEPASPLAPASADTTPEIGFSDVFQTSTTATSPALTVEDEVGVIPFKWFKNEGAAAGLTNITPLLFQQLYGSLANLPLALFTGLEGDQGSLVFPIGRNSDSGTRITALAESGYGVFRDVVQYGANVTTSGDTITALGTPGNLGYSSGGNLSSALQKTFTGGSIVGYLGASDWSSAVAGGAVEIQWNGVTFSEDNVRQGKYTFWGYLHQNRMALAGQTLTFYNALRDALLANPGSGVVTIGSMDVARDGDGAPVYNSTY